MGSFFMDLDAVTSSVCGIAHFEGLPVYGEQHRKIKSKSENSTYCSFILFSRNMYFSPTKKMVMIERNPFYKRSEKELSQNYLL